MRETISSCMEYYPEMEQINSDIMSKVLAMSGTVNFDSYTQSDVQSVLSKDFLSPEDFTVLLSPAAEQYVEPMIIRAKTETFKHFGNSVCLFTPIYIANYCENQCVYCGFNCMNKIKRAKLSLDEIETDMQNIAQTGLKEILILTGEARNASGVEYIGDAIKIAKKYFLNIGIEIYPLNSDEYNYLHSCGADFVSVYQETYIPDIYDKVHPFGHKRSYPYRFNAQERALMGGMRGVSFGSLLGLGEFRKDSFSAGYHAYLIQKKYPHAEISFSFPRIRPYVNKEFSNSGDVFEMQLLQLMLAFRIFMPYAGITISTRERDFFRNNIVGIAATKISAGVSVGVGGHASDTKGDEQFEISDPRSVQEIHHMLLSEGLQPVYNDYVRV